MDDKKLLSIQFTAVQGDCSYSIDDCDNPALHNKLGSYRFARLAATLTYH